MFRNPLTKMEQSLFFSGIVFTKLISCLIDVLLRQHSRVSFDEFYGDLWVLQAGCRSTSWSRKRLNLIFCTGHRWNFCFDWSWIIFFLDFIEKVLTPKPSEASWSPLARLWWTGFGVFCHEILIENIIFTQFKTFHLFITDYQVIWFSLTFLYLLNQF